MTENQAINKMRTSFLACEEGHDLTRIINKYLNLAKKHPHWLALMADVITLKEYKNMHYKDVL